MEKIDFSLLNLIKSDKKNKNIKSKENHKAMLQFFYSQNNIFKFISTDFSVYELTLWIKSKANYINKKTTKNTTNYFPKNILFVDLGENLGSELSYEHVCVVLKAEYEKLFVIPCSSSRVARATNPKTGTLFPEYLIGTTADGFTKETALLLNDAKWISKNRVISNTGYNISNSLFSAIYESVFSLLFPSKSNQIAKLEQIKNENFIKIQNLNNIIKDQNDKIEKLSKRNKKIGRHRFLKK